MTKDAPTLEQHRRILSASAAPMLLVDASGQVLAANEGAHRLFGYPAEALVGLSVDVLVPTSFRERHATLRRGFATTEGSRAMAYGRRVGGVCADGSALDVEVALRPVSLEDGRGVVATIRDLSLEDEARRLVEDDVARFKELAESLPQLVWVASGSGHVEYVNSRWLVYTGLPRTALLGEGWLEVVHAEDRALAGQQTREGVEGLEPFDYLARLQRQDGVWRTFQVRARPVLDDEGRALRWYGSATDVEDLRVVNARLAALNAELEARVQQRTQELSRVTHRVLAITAQLAAAQDLSVIGSWSIQAVGKARPDLSSALIRMFGLDERDEPELDALLDAFDEPHRKVLREALDALLTEQTAFELELPYRQPGGEGGWVVARGSALPASVSSVYIVGVFQDVTATVAARQELARRTEELQRSNQDLGQFAYAASHDLQEPLRAVSGCAQILRATYGEHLDEGGKELIDHMVDGADRMRALVQDLLTYSRVGTLQRPHEGVSLAEVVALAWAERAPDAGEAALDAGPLPTVLGDASQLRQLFTNLFSNAVKYRSKAPPYITIRACVVDGAHQIDVADNGIGIEPAYHERVFVLFERLHTRTEYPGTGIGLALCRRIVEKHGGTIAIVPGDASGTTFRITLPAGTP